MPRWSLDGCAQFCFVALCVVGLLTVPLYCEHRSGQGDDPYFHTAPCPDESREVRFPYHRSLWWTNGVARDYPVTVLPVPGQRFAATDIIVRREVPITD